MNLAFLSRLPRNQGVNQSLTEFKIKHLQRIFMMNNLNYCCACNFGTSRAKTGGNEINCNFTIWRCLNYRIIDSTWYYRISDTLDELSRTVQYWSPVYMVHWYIMMVYLYRSFSKRIKYGSVKAFVLTLFLNRTDHYRIFLHRFQIGMKELNRSD